MYIVLGTGKTLKSVPIVTYGTCNQDVLDVRKYYFCFLRGEQGEHARVEQFHDQLEISHKRVFCSYELENSLKMKRCTSASHSHSPRGASQVEVLTSCRFLSFGGIPSNAA